MACLCFACFCSALPCTAEFLVRPGSTTVNLLLRRKKPNCHYAFVSFASAEHRAAADAALRKLRLTGRPLAVADATSGRDGGQARPGPAEAPRSVADMDVRDTVTPLWRVGPSTRGSHA